MTDMEQSYPIWVDWDSHRASTVPVEGYEMICFFTRERYQENLRILTESGFQVQGERTP